MSLSNPLPVSDLGPQWTGVKVAVTCAGFNLGTHVGDQLEDVEHRRGMVQAHMGAPIAWLNQVHGCEIFQADDSGKVGDVLAPPSADASVSRSPDITLAIMTADCLPVVFAAFDENGSAVGVAAAHAGWRGLHAGVLQATVEKLSKACGVNTSNVKAWMGPAIGPESFEVGQEVLDQFCEQNPINNSFFKTGITQGKYFADIYGLARNILSNVDVAQVEGGGLDTFTDSRWDSYRRSLQQGQAQGRFATLIRLLPGQAV